MSNTPRKARTVRVLSVAACLLVAAAVVAQTRDQDKRLLFLSRGCPVRC